VIELAMVGGRHGACWGGIAVAPGDYVADRVPSIGGRCGSVAWWGLIMGYVYRVSLEFIPGAEGCHAGFPICGLARVDLRARCLVLRYEVPVRGIGRVL